MNLVDKYCERMDQELLRYIKYSNTGLLDWSLDDLIAKEPFSNVYGSTGRKSFPSIIYHEITK